MSIDIFNKKCLCFILQFYSNYDILLIVHYIINNKGEDKNA